MVSPVEQINTKYTARISVSQYPTCDCLGLFTSLNISARLVPSALVIRSAATIEGVLYSRSMAHMQLRREDCVKSTADVMISMLMNIFFDVLDTLLTE